MHCRMAPSTDLLLWRGSLFLSLSSTLLCFLSRVSAGIEADLSILMARRKKGKGELKGVRKGEWKKWGGKGQFRLERRKTEERKWKDRRI